MGCQYKYNRNNVVTLTVTDDTASPCITSSVYEDLICHTHESKAQSLALYIYCSLFSEYFTVFLLSFLVFQYLRNVSSKL